MIIARTCFAVALAIVLASGSTKAGTLVVGAGRNLTWLDASTGASVKSIELGFEDRVLSLTFGRDGWLWVGTDSAFVQRVHPETGELGPRWLGAAHGIVATQSSVVIGSGPLIKWLDPATGVTQRTASLVDADEAISMTLGPDGSLWVGTQTAWVQQIDTVTGTLGARWQGGALGIAASQDSVFTTSGSELRWHDPLSGVVQQSIQLFESDTGISMAHDASGSIWVGTQTAYVQRVNAQTGEFGERWQFAAIGLAVIPAPGVIPLLIALGALATRRRPRA